MSEEQGVNPDDPVPAVDVEEAASRGPGWLSVLRLKRRRPMSLVLVVLALLLWLLSIALTVDTIHRRGLPTWSCWRLADQHLRLSSFEIHGMPAALFEDREETLDRKELMKRWADLLERNNDSRSRTGAVILWHLAGDETRAKEAYRDDPAEPVRSRLIEALVYGGQPYPEDLSWWEEYVTMPQEFYWWEEQLGLELAARPHSQALPELAKVAEHRSRRCLKAAMWRSGLELTFAVGGSLLLGIYLWRRRRQLKWHRVPGAFPWIGWRRVIVGLAVVEVLALVAMLVFSWRFAASFEWTRRNLILYATLGSWLVPFFMLLLFFPNPLKAVRALRVNCRFDLAPVFGAFALAIVASTLGSWLLPRGPENLLGFGVDPSTFGAAGLGYALWLGCVVAPLGEEIVFRGFLFNGLASRFGMLAGMIVASGVFAAVHGYGWSASASVFAGGVLASLLYRLSGSLGAPMLFHALFNLYAFAGTWFALEVPYW